MYKKIVFKKETISNLNNKQMNNVIGGKGLTDVYELCWGASNVTNCTHYCDSGPGCPPFTVSSGTSICYDVCY